MRSRRLQSLPGLVLGLALVCLAAGCAEATGGYESTPIELAAQDVLEGELRSGEGYEVADPVRGDGFALRYTVGSTRFGSFSASSDDMLPVRIQEVRALGSLSHVSSSETFKDSAVESAKTPFRVIKSLATEPGKTLKGAGQGVKKAGKKAGGWIGGDRRERADTEDSAFKEAIGYSRRKRKLAHSLGVDVYSSNEKLQDELDRVARASVSGGMSFAALMMVVPIPPVINLVRHTTGFTKGMNALIASKSGGDLYKMNREILRGMGYPDEQSEPFLNDEQLSPRHKTFIVAAMKDMQGVEGLGEIITLGRQIGSEEQALRLQRTTELARGYHRNIAPLRTIVRVNREILLLTEDGDVVAALPADRLLWTEQADQLAKAMWDAEVVGADVSERHLWVTGEFSERASDHLGDREILLHESASHRLEAS